MNCWKPCHRLGRLWGTGYYQTIVQVLQRVERGERVRQVSPVPEFVGDHTLNTRFRTTPEPVVYALKFAEGCDYRCAFCIIPGLRGNQRSRPIESIMSEANQLAEQGAKEPILDQSDHRQTTGSVSMGVHIWQSSRQLCQMW